MSSVSSTTGTVPPASTTPRTTVSGVPSATSGAPSSTAVLTSASSASATPPAPTATTPATSAFTTPSRSITLLPTISSGLNSNTDTSAATTSVAPTLPAPNTSSAAFTTLTFPPATTIESTTAVIPAPSSSAASSIITTTEASTSVSVTSLLPVSTSAISTSAVGTTSTTRLVTSALPTRSVPRTTINVSRPTSFSLIRITSSGLVQTITVVVGGTPSPSLSSAAAKKSFFQHTGAVVGVFLVIGIAVTALLILIGTTFLRRRRANQFDKEVQEAAREAARAQAPIDDDGGASFNTHGSQSMSKRPGAHEGYGATATSSWDPYGRAAAAGAGGEFGMQQRRMGTGPVGFATSDAFARSMGITRSEGHNSNQGYAQDSYNTGYGGNQTYQTSYRSMSPPQPYTLARPELVGQGEQAGRAPIHAQMLLPEGQRYSYTADDPFRSSPSNEQTRSEEQVECGNAVGGNNMGSGYDTDPRRVGYVPRPPEQAKYAPPRSQDSYSEYNPYDAYAEPGPSISHGYGSSPPSYVGGPSGNVGATGEGKGRAVGRWRSGRSGTTRYSQEDESDEGSPPKRVLRIANE